MSRLSIPIPEIPSKAVVSRATVRAMRMMCKVLNSVYKNSGVKVQIRAVMRNASEPSMLFFPDAVL